MKRNNNENKKIVFKFVIVMILLFLLGVLVGTAIAALQKTGNYKTTLETVKNHIYSVSPVIFLCIIVVTSVILMCLYISCLRTFKKLQEDMDNEELWNDLEIKMNKPMILADLMLVIDLFIFGICLAYYNDFTNPVNVINLVLEVIEFAFCTFISSRVLNIHKSLNPDKKGHVLDFKFNRVWLSVSDEAEKEIIYKSGYQAYKNVNIICIILFAVTFIGMLTFDTGVFSYLCVCVIEVVNVLSYSLHIAKLEKGE